jgi:hypothetical protein
MVRMERPTITHPSKVIRTEEEEDEDDVRK